MFAKLHEIMQLSKMFYQFLCILIIICYFCNADNNYLSTKFILKTETKTKTKTKTKTNTTIYELPDRPY